MAAKNSVELDRQIPPCEHLSRPVRPLQGATLDEVSRAPRMKTRFDLVLVLVIGGALGAAACGSGDIAETSLPQATPPNGAVQTVTSTATPEDCIQPSCQELPLPATPHAVRLTSPQWERTIQDLLKLDAQPGSSVDFPSDPVPSADRFGRLPSRCPRSSRTTRRRSPRSSRPPRRRATRRRASRPSSPPSCRVRTVAP
jgi:hypothetical protein